MEIAEINCGTHRAHVGNDALSIFSSHMEIASPPVSKCVVLCDSNTYEHCLPVLMKEVPLLREAAIMEIPAGEQSKNINTAKNLWSQLIASELDRNSLLINLGGGVVSDLGGFVAATFKRGIRYVNLPTSLLGMVDAAIGGKTGVDVEHLKNIVGLFAPPNRVYIHVPFLRTLSKRQMLNGLAEMFKHGLIKDAGHWRQLMRAPLHDPDSMAPLIFHSSGLKAQVVMEDPNESGIRKILNFGHTIGHAIESLALESDRKELFHGESIAIGMICEARISQRMNLINEAELHEINDVLSALFPIFPLVEEDTIRILELMRNDKKNQSSEFRFTLLKGIGEAIHDQQVEIPFISEALSFYRQTRK